MHVCMTYESIVDASSKQRLAKPSLSFFWGFLSQSVISASDAVTIIVVVCLPYSCSLRRCRLTAKEEEKSMKCLLAEDGRGEEGKQGG